MQRLPEARAAASVMKAMIYCACDGGAKGDRTPDLGIANAALSQLSYRPGPQVARLLVPGRSGVKLACGVGAAYMCSERKHWRETLP